MISNIIDLLNLSEHYGVSKTVDIAKGKYKVPYTWKELRKKIKRIWNGR